MLCLLCSGQPTQGRDAPKLAPFVRPLLFFEAGKMVQRLTYRRRHSFATKSNKQRLVKTPGGKLVYQLHKKQRCGAPGGFFRHEWMVCAEPQRLAPCTTALRSLTAIMTAEGYGNMQPARLA